MSPLVEVPEGASPEEVAAIVAALTALEEERREATPPPLAGRDHHLDAWVQASRLGARRAGLIRGPWRLAGRISRRNRA